MYLIAFFSSVSTTVPQQIELFPKELIPTVISLGAEFKSWIKGQRFVLVDFDNDPAMGLVRVYHEQTERGSIGQQPQFHFARCLGQVGQETNAGDGWPE